MADQKRGRSAAGLQFLAEKFLRDAKIRREALLSFTLNI